MNSLAARAIKADRLEGLQIPLEPISQVGNYKEQMDVDGVVKMSVNGGAWIALFAAAGPVTTLQEAYDGGGALGTGLGRTIGTMTGAVVMTNSGANGNNVLEINKTPAGAQAGGGIAITVGANATGSPLTIVDNNPGVSPSVSITTNGNIQSLNVGSNAATANVVVVSCAHTANVGISLTQLNVALTGALTLARFDASAVTGANAGANAVTGLRIDIPATTRGDNPLEAALVIDSQATLARGVDLAVANTASSGIFTLRYRLPTLLVADTTGMFLNLSANVTGGGVTTTGLYVFVGNSTAPVANSGSRCAVFDYRSPAGTTVGVVSVINTGLAAPLTGPLTGVVVDLTSANHGGQALVGVSVNLPGLGVGLDLVTTVTGGTAIRIGSLGGVQYGTAIAIGQVGGNQPANGLICAAGATAGGIINRFFSGDAGWVGAPTLLDLSLDGSQTITLTGINLTVTRAPGGVLSTTINAQNILVTGQGAAATDPTSDSYCLNLDYRSVNGTAAGNGILNLGVGAARTLSGILTGIEADLSANITGNNRDVRAIRAIVGGGAIGNDVSSASTGFQCDWRGVRGTSTGITNLFNTSLAAALTGPLFGLVIDFTSANHGNQGLNGVSVSIGATSSASAYGVNVTSAQTAGFGIGVTMTGAAALSAVRVTMEASTVAGSSGVVVDWLGTAGTNGANGAIAVTNASLGGALTGPINGLNILLTSANHGNQALNGVVINLAASAIASAAGRGAVVVDSQLTAGRVFDVAIANTTGTPILFRYRAATTPAPVVMMTLDLQTFVNSNANANVGLDIPIVAADEDTTAPLRMNTMRNFVGTGAPNNANGSNGDVYERIDGGVASSYYKKIAGAWTALA